MTLSYYSNKSRFFKAGCVRLKHEKHSQDSKKTAECQPYEFAKVNTIAVI